MGLEYIQLFADMEQYFEPYSDAERGRLTMAMMAYAFRGEEPSFPGNERFIWPILRNHIDRCVQNVESKKANGSKGGRPAKGKTEEKQTKPEETEKNLNEADESEEKLKNHTQDQEHDQDHEYEYDHEQEKGKKKARARFAPPSQQEADTFFKENGGTAEQATRFCAYYESKGWTVGKSPMKDWKAAARGWISRDKDGQFGGAQREPMQRHSYTQNDYNRMIIDLDKEDDKTKKINGDMMLRYTPEERRETYSAAILDFDEVENGG